MTKEKLAEELIAAAQEFNGFVYGGYVRDFIVNGEDFKDIDLYVPANEIFNFLWITAKHKPTIEMGTPASKYTPWDDSYSLFHPYESLIENYPWHRLKLDFHLFTVDLCKEPPSLGHYDFDVNSLCLKKEGIYSMFEKYYDTEWLNSFSIMSNIAAKKATHLRDFWRLDAIARQNMLDREAYMESKGYQIQDFPY